MNAVRTGHFMAFSNSLTTICITNLQLLTYEVIDGGGVVQISDVFEKEVVGDDSQFAHFSRHLFPGGSFV